MRFYTELQKMSVLCSIFEAENHRRKSFPEKHFKTNTRHRVFSRCQHILKIASKYWLLPLRTAARNPNPSFYSMGGYHNSPSPSSRRSHAAIWPQKTSKIVELYNITIFILFQGLNHFSIEAWVRTLCIIKFFKHAKHIAKLGFTRQDQFIQALGFYGLHKAFRKRIHHGTVAGKPFGK